MKKLYWYYARNTFVVTALFWVLVNVLFKVTPLTNTSLLLFWDPQIPRWVGDSLCLSLLLPAILVWVKTEHSMPEFKTLPAEVWCGVIVGFFLNLLLPAAWALGLGILALMLLGLNYQWNHEREDFSWWGLFIGPMIWQGYMPGLCLGLGVLNGFFISLWLSLFLVVLPLALILLLFVAFSIWGEG